MDYDDASDDPAIVSNSLPTSLHWREMRSPLEGLAGSGTISYGGLATTSICRHVELPLAFEVRPDARLHQKPMDTNLTRIPIYEQLNQRLRAAITESYGCGDRFLTEREISAKFQVSRATANKALASLVSEGLLQFRRGIGTFVQRNPIDYDVRSLVSFTEKARAAGKRPRTELITFGKLTSREIANDLRDALEMEENSIVWEMVRLRLANKVPVILEHRFVVERHCPKLTKSQLQGSLYSVWTETLGLDIGGADETIRSVLLNKNEAMHLRVPARSPALEVVAIGFLRDSSPLWWERTLYRGDQYEFQSRLGPIQSATPPRGQLR